MENKRYRWDDISPDNPVPLLHRRTLSGEQVVGALVRLVPGCKVALHSHESEQITMVLTGELFFEVQGVVHCIRPGEVIAIPSSLPHSVWTEALAVTAIDAWSPVMRKYGSVNA